MKTWTTGMLWLLCFQTLTPSRAEDRLLVEPVEKWSNVFSGSEVTLHYTVRTSAAFEGRLDWSLSVNRRTVEHGQTSVKAAAEAPAGAAITLRVPEVREGVILEAWLSVAARADGGQKRLAEQERTVWIFPRDPFANRTDWLRGLKITLFDPEGTTADVLEKARVPFTFTKNSSALDEVSDGILLIGEGTAWKDYRSLGDSMVKAAARGVPVLCLAPGDGAMPLPGTQQDAGLPAPKSLCLRQDDMIAELDKRLDAVAWPREGRIAASRLAVTSDRDQVVLEVTSQPGAWPWLEARYAPPKGRLLICGWRIIDRWEATPAPRYLLSKLLARLADGQTTRPAQEERKDP